tara:strand:+ start:602 stop:811 length:210 start_codon:yes stop_codon:yes gene_type:complete
MLEIEIWPYVSGSHKVYTNNEKMKNELCTVLKIENASCTYMKKGKPFAWDLIFNDVRMSTVKRIIKKYN